MWFIKLGLVLAVAIGAITVLASEVQTRILFPTHQADRYRPTLPASAEDLEVSTPDGERLYGVHIPPSSEPAGTRLIVLGFPGSGWNAAGFANYLHEVFPGQDIVAFHYRGYSPSTGSPSANAILADAPIVYDFVAERFRDAPIVAVGASLGTGVAAYLAANRPVAGAILVSPYDSLNALALEDYMWPIGWILPNHIKTVDYVRDVSAPIAVITGDRDTTVSPRRSNVVRQAIPFLIYDRTIAGANHDNLYRRPAFRTAMNEALARIRDAKKGTDQSATH